MSNVMIGAVSSFKPGDKVVIAKKNIYSSARTGTVLRSIYPGKELVKTSKGMFYMDPKDLSKKAINGLDSYKFNIYEQGDINEKSGLAEYKKIKTVNIKRASLESAHEFLRKKYSYKNTGKNYIVEY